MLRCSRLGLGDLRLRERLFRLRERLRGVRDLSRGRPRRSLREREPRWRGLRSGERDAWRLRRARLPSRAGERESRLVVWVSSGRAWSPALRAAASPVSVLRMSPRTYCCSAAIKSSSPRMHAADVCAWSGSFSIACAPAHCVHATYDPQVVHMEPACMSIPLRCMVSPPSSRCIR